MARGTLSVVCRTAAAGPRPAALLATLRPLADEILVAVDDRSDPGARGDLEAVADRLLLYPFLEPQDRPLPWLLHEARSDWVLLVDDDEVPSLALLGALPALCADESVVHVSFPRRWLFPDPSTYLDDSPWVPDYALRLVRNDPRLVRFTDDFHRTLLADGPGRFAAAPLWHADAILRTREERLEKARRYERTRPGLRIGGRALNFAFYVPELRAEPPLASVPADERAHLERVLAAGPQPGPPRARVERAAREDVDRRWPVKDAASQDGSLEPLERPERLFADEARAVDALVRNTGRAAWPWGPDGAPAVRASSRWRDAAGRELPELEIHTPLPAPLPPGEEQLVPVHVRAPAAAGGYRLAVGLVHEHERRLDVEAEWAVEVVRQPRLAVVGGDDAIAEVAEVLARVPELQLLRLVRNPSSAPRGHPEAPDARAYLFDAPPRLGFRAGLLWRSLRLRFGPTPPRAHGFLDALRRSDVLVVAALDGPEQRRERRALAVLERTARSLGLGVVETRDPDEILRALGR